MFERQTEKRRWILTAILTHKSVISNALRFLFPGETYSLRGHLWATSSTPAVILYLPTARFYWPLKGCSHLTWASVYTISQRPHISARPHDCFCLFTQVRPCAVKSLIDGLVKGQCTTTWTIERTLTGTTTSGQSWPESNSNEHLLHIPQNARIRASLSNDLELHTGHSLRVGVLLFANIKSARSTALTDWAEKERKKMLEF